MNRKTIAAVLAVTAAAFAGQALAESPNAVPEQQFVGAKTRAEVQADLANYQAAGVNPWSTQYNPLKSFKSAASRDAVVADYVASRNVVAATTGEDSGSAYLAQGRAVNTGTTLAGQPGSGAE